MHEWKMREVHDVKFIDLKTGKEILYLDSLSLISDEVLFRQSNIIKPLVEVKIVDNYTQKEFYKLMDKEQLNEYISDKSIVEDIMNGKYIAEFDVSYEVK